MAVNRTRLMGLSKSNRMKIQQNLLIVTGFGAASTQIDATTWLFQQTTANSSTILEYRHTTSPAIFTYLVVAGGGNGYSSIGGGGGGAGGYLTGTTSMLTGYKYRMVPGANTVNSTLDSGVIGESFTALYTAIAGGSGGGGVGGSGGSGAGGNGLGNGSYGGYTAGGSGTSGQGNNGGAGQRNDNGDGGGGGGGWELEWHGCERTSASLRRFVRGGGRGASRDCASFG